MKNNVWLACVKHLDSVQSEPSSNSINFIWIYIYIIFIYIYVYCVDKGFAPLYIGHEPIMLTITSIHINYTYLLIFITWLYSNNIIIVNIYKFFLTMLTALYFINYKKYKVLLYFYIFFYFFFVF